MKPMRALYLLILAAAVAVPASSQNHLANGSFDDDSMWWDIEVGPTLLEVDWVTQDALGQPPSGSLRVADVSESDIGTIFGVAQCVDVDAGDDLDLSAWVKIPPGQDRTGGAYLQVVWYSSATCTGNNGFERDFTVEASQQWQLLQVEGVMAPAGTQSAEVQLRVGGHGATGTFAALFDEVNLCPAGTCPVQSIPGPPYAQWIQSPQLPGFSAQVRIAAGGGTFPGIRENDCIAETICVRGLVPGRPEIFIKVVGPRPNGYLWSQVTRFTPSKVDVWLRQDSTGAIRWYRLDAVPPTAGELSGIEDRTAYLP